MLETRQCFSCGQMVYVHDCHYQCTQCGYAENWQDISGRYSQKGKINEVKKKGENIKRNEGKVVRSGKKAKRLHTEKIW